MGFYKSFKTIRKKLRKTWDDTEENLNDADDLEKLQVIDFSKAQLYRQILDFIILQDSNLIDSTIYLAKSFDFIFENLPEAAISSIYILQKFTSASEVSIIRSATEAVERIQEIKPYFKRGENDNQIICQVRIPQISIFTNETFREIKVYVVNPNEIFSVQPRIQ